MVKSQIRVVPNAGYESQHRTLPISEKLSEGATIVPVVQSSGKHAGEFSAERMIHGKIREYTLRSASHWNAVNQAVDMHSAALDANIAHIEADHATAADHLTLIAQSMHSESLHGLGFPKIQKGLREFVLAHMLRDAVGVSRVSVHAVSSSSSIGESVPAGSLNKSGLSHLISSIIRHISSSHSKGKISNELSSKDYKALHAYASTKQYETVVSSITEWQATGSLHGISGTSLWRSAASANTSHKRDDLFLLLSLLIVSGLRHDAAKGLASSNGHKLSRFSDSDFKRVSFEGSSRRSGSISHPISIEDVCGFGTAPIWYQQSMATGPPQAAFSLE